MEIARSAGRAYAESRVSALSAAPLAAYAASP